MNAGRVAGFPQGRALDEQPRVVQSSADSNLVANEIGGRQPPPKIRLYDLRIDRGWTQEQVAKMIAELAAANGKTTGIDANTVSRLERGQLSWPQTLVAEFECLFGCSAADLGFVNRRVGGSARSHHGARQDGTSSALATPVLVPPMLLLPESGSLGADSLEALSPDAHSPSLTAYGTPQLYIVGSNDDYRRAFPGVAIGTNLLEWAVLNPRAREVLVEWELEIELLGNSLREAASDPRNVEARTILQKCRDESPEFREILDRGNTDVQRPYPYQLLRDLDSGEIHRVGCTVWVANTNGEPAHLYVGRLLKPPTEM